MAGARRPRQSYQWKIAQPFAGAKELARQLATTPLVAQVLSNRHVADFDAAKSFLNPKLADLHPPELLANVVPAAERIVHAVRSAQPIAIYGDYDVDGMTGLAILRSCLALAGADVRYYVPHRLNEGYGVNSQAMAKLIADGSKLVVTVDCGISAVEPVAEAMAGGTDVIVTDHHGLPPELPPALAVVHPHLPCQPYPNRHLCGAGVAFKLAWQVAKCLCGSARVDSAMRDFLLDSMCLAALGTIADVVPLVGENRVFATFGLKGLAGTRHTGLRALIEASSLEGKRLDAYHVGFVLAPRLNACGRMGHAQLAVELLTQESPDKARQIAEYLDRQNVQRQKVERQIAEQATEMVDSQGLDDDHRAIVLAGQDWHGGVIGIVAARLVEKYRRPCVLIALGEDGLGHGSARSIEGFHMLQALSACGQYLESFGGHAMAGGLKIQPGRIDAFREAFADYARRQLEPEQLVPSLAIDAQTTLAELNHNAVSHLERLAPFGQGNPPPLVAVRGCRMLGQPRRVGQGGNVLSVLLEQGGVRLRAVGFGLGDLAERLSGVNSLDVAGQPVLNSFNGSSSVELRLRDLVY